MRVKIVAIRRDGYYVDEEIDTEEVGCLANAEKDLSPEQYAQIVIDNFNKTLRPEELPRRLVSAEAV